MDPSRAVRTLKRFFLVILASAAVGAAVGYETAPAASVYQSSAEVVVGESHLPTDATATAAVDLLAVTVGTYARMIPSSVVAQRAVTVAGLPLPAGTVAGETQATAVPGTSLISITVNGATPDAAQRVADAVARGFVAYIDDTRSQPGGASFAAEPVRLFQPADRPSAPLPVSRRRRVEIGAAFGLVLSAAALVLLDALFARRSAGTGATVVAGGEPEPGKADPTAVVAGGEPERGKADPTAVVAGGEPERGKADPTAVVAGGGPEPGPANPWPGKVDR